MMLAILIQPFIQALGWTLLHFLWQGALLACLLAITGYLLKNSSANLRYSIACGALLLMLLLPAVTLWRAYTPIKPAEQIAAQTETSTAVNLPAPAANPIVKSSAATEVSTNWPLKLNAALPWFVAIWLLGVVVLSLRFIGGLIVAERIKRRYTMPVSDALQHTVTRLTRRLRISRAVRVCHSIAAEVPVVIGWLRPVVLLPAGALTGMTTQQIEAIIAHELAHIRRHDYLINILQGVIETFLFYHPAVWWVSNQVRIEREHCCDDIAVKVCGDPVAYARALTELEQIRCGAPQFAMAVTGGSLLKRVQRLLTPPAHRSSPALIGLIVLMATFIIGLGAQTAFSSEPEQKPIRLSPPKNVTIQLNKSAQADHDDDDIDNDIDDNNDHDGDIDNDVDTDHDMDSDVDNDHDDDNDHDSDIDNDNDSDDAHDIEIDNDRDNDSDDDDELSANLHDINDRNSFALSQENAQELAAELAKLGYSKVSVDELVALKIHGVTPDFIREIKALGYDKIDLDDLVAFKIHGVTPQFITQTNSQNGTRLSAETLLAMKIHGVTPEFAQEMKAAGFTNLSTDTLLAMKIHGINGKFAQEIRAMGYNVDAENLLAFRIHGVTPAFIQSVKALGFNKADNDDLLAMKIHNVNPEFIRSIREAGYPNISLEDLTAYKIHGITPAFIKEAKSRGFNNLSPEEMIQLKRTGLIKVKQQ